MTAREGLAAAYRLAEAIHASEHADNPITRLRSVSDPRLTVAACFACMRTADAVLTWLTEQLADEGLREAVAEEMSWSVGDMTRYGADAHPDHNRWSWRGDGHGEAVRETYRELADAALSAVRAHLTENEETKK